MLLLVEHCQMLLNTHGSVYLALLVVGLVGSVTHCAGMCGPFVATQVSARLDKIPANQMREWHRLQGAALLPYHFGRITTYTLLGALAGGFSSLLFASSYFPLVSSGMLAVAGMLFLMQAFNVRITNHESRIASHALTRLSRSLWQNPTGAHGFLLGILLGFLPCGMVMAALMTVATIGSPFAAGLGMMVFGIGTIPGLFLVGLGSHFAARRWRKETRLAARGAMAINGILLCGLAARQII
jgi:sulfite exporter TauE/SafE